MAAADPNDYEVVANPNDFEVVSQQPVAQSTPIIPRSGAQMESLEAREFTRTSPDQVRGTGDQPVIPIPRVPQQQGILGQLGAGAVNIGAGLAEMAETPANIAALPVAPAKLSQILFAGQAFKDIGTAFEEARQPGTSVQKGLELGGRALTDALFGVGMARGAIEPTAPLTERAAAEVQPRGGEVSAIQKPSTETVGAQPVGGEGVGEEGRQGVGQGEQGQAPAGTQEAVTPVSTEGQASVEAVQPKGGDVVEKVQEGKEGQGERRDGVLSEPAAGEKPPSPAAAVPPAIGKNVAKDIPGIPKEVKAVGLTHDYISKDRAARGEEPLAQAARKSNPQSWSKAEQTFKANPNAGHELVASLTENPRPVTEDDLGVLLRHRVDLTNQTDFEFERLTSPELSPQDRGAASVKLAALNDARNQADAVTANAGSQAGRTMQFLQKMATQDYSLSGLIQQRRAAIGGQDLSPGQIQQASEYSKEILEKDAAWQNYLKTNQRTESALKAYKTRLKVAATEYERRKAFSDFEPQIRKQLELDPEAQRLRGELDTAKNKWNDLLAKDQLANRPMWQKILGGVAWAARESALSGYHTLAKLFGFTAGKLVEMPLNQTAERVWGAIPGFREIAAKSEFGPGANAKQLGTFYREFFTTGMKQAWQQLRTGRSDFKAKYGDDRIPINYPSFFGQLHGVEKTPLRVGSTEMNRQRIIDNTMEQLAAKAVSEGHDVSDSIVQGAINKLAFDAGTNDILMGNNLFADKVNELFRSMEGKTKKTGEPSIELNILSTLAKTFFTKGIVRTPANFVTQVFERTPLGLARGLGRAVRANYKGVENVTPAERTAIMRLLGAGSVGSGMFLWGALDALKSPDKRVFGGYYQPGEKRDGDDVQWGKVRVGGYTAPHYFTHNLLSEPAQMGNTMMRVATSALSKKDRTNRGLVAGTIAATLGLAEQAPIANPAVRLQQLGDPRQQSRYVADIVRGLIPQLVQNIAQDMDKSDVQRKPTGIKESLMLGIPGLRQQVPERQEKQPSSKQAILMQ